MTGAFQAFRRPSFFTVSRPKFLHMWTQISPLGEGPCPRGGHTATLVDNHVIVFGGSNRLGTHFDTTHVLAIGFFILVLGRRLLTKLVQEKMKVSRGMKFTVI